MGLDDLFSVDTLLGGAGGALTTGLATGFNPWAMGAGALAGGYSGYKKHDAADKLRGAQEGQQAAIGEAREMLNANKASQYRQRVMDINKALSMFDPTNQLYHQMHGGPMHGGRLDVPALPAPPPAPPGPAPGQPPPGPAPYKSADQYPMGGPNSANPMDPNDPRRSMSGNVAPLGPNSANPMDPNDPRRSMGGYVPPAGPNQADSSNPNDPRRSMNGVEPYRRGTFG